MSKATIGPLTLALAFVVAPPALAQPKAPKSHDEFREVDLHILPDQTLEVTETWRTIFPAGKFSVYRRWLPLRGLQGIGGVEVSVDGRAYPYDAGVWSRVTTRLTTGQSGDGRPGFATWTQGGNFSIGICFPESSDQGRHFQIRYRVQGALRTFGTSLRLHWVAIGSEQARWAEVNTVTVQLPAPVAPDQLRASSSGVPATRTVLDARTVRWTARRGNGSSALAVQVYFPHLVDSGRLRSRLARSVALVGNATNLWTALPLLAADAPRVVRHDREAGPREHVPPARQEKRWPVRERRRDFEWLTGLPCFLFMVALIFVLNILTQRGGGPHSGGPFGHSDHGSSSGSSSSSSTSTWGMGGGWGGSCGGGDSYGGSSSGGCGGGLGGGGGSFG